MAQPIPFIADSLIEACKDVFSGITAEASRCATQFFLSKPEQTMPNMSGEAPHMPEGTSVARSGSALEVCAAAILQAAEHAAEVTHRRYYTGPHISDAMSMWHVLD